MSNYLIAPVILVCVIALCSCDSVPNAQEEANAKLVQRLSQLENRIAQLEQRKSQMLDRQPKTTGDWVLWYQAEGINAGYPAAQTAFSTKEACLESAAQWSVPKGEVVSRDPYIIRNKSGGIIYRCLPQGINPLQRN
jgi:hypothetical protein